MRFKHLIRRQALLNAFTFHSRQPSSSFVDQAERMKNFSVVTAVCVAMSLVASARGGGKRSSIYTSPYHRWSFNGNAIDTVGGLKGTLHGNTTFSNDAFEGRMSLQLGCCDSSVTIDDYSLKESFTYYTVSMWFREEQRTGHRRYLYEEGGAKTGFAIRLNGDKLEAAVVEGGGGPEYEKVASCGSVELGKWHHAAVVYSNGTLKVMLDGNSSSTIETGYGELAQHFHAASIGGGGLSDYKSSVRFVGLVDDLRIWDGIALTSNQIDHLVYASNKKNFLVIIADDMNGDSPGFMGGVAPDVTPNLDRLANESLVFTLAHAATSVCQSSRQSMLSGKYPPNYGNVGFFPMADGTETVVSNLRRAGYLTSTYHKFWHMRPFSSFPWDMTERNTYFENQQYQADGRAKKIGRSPRMLAQGVKQTIRVAKSTNKPFFAVINSADPHRPFYGAEGDAAKNATEQMEVPSRIYRPHEVKVPHPLPDIQSIRKDVAMYASSIRRLDDAVGACLEVLEHEGVADNTVVIFVSDNGMPMPYGKFETYRDSLRGPMVVRWPSTIDPRVDSETLVSLTDLAPTILDIANAQPLDDIDGRSLLPVIHGEPGVQWRDVVVGSRYEDIYYGNGLAKLPDPETERAILRAQGWVDATDHHIEGTMKRMMNKRGVTDGIHHYIYNHFFNASNKILAYPYGSEALWAMEKAARRNATIAEQVDFYSYRAREECYDLTKDPGFHKNLIAVPGEASEAISFLRGRLLAWMRETSDPVLHDYEQYLSATF